VPNTTSCAVLLVWREYTATQHSTYTAQHVHGTAQQAAVITSVITRTNAAEILESFIYHVLIYPVN